MTQDRNPDKLPQCGAFWRLQRADVVSYFAAAMKNNQSAQTLVALIQVEQDPRRLSALVDQLCKLVDKEKRWPLTPAPLEKAA